MPELSRILRVLRRMAGHLLHLRFRALHREMSRAVSVLLAPLSAGRKRRALRVALAGRTSGKRVILFPPTLDYHLPLYQRPQQLARAYSRRPDTLVLYLTANTRFDHVSVMEALSPSLLLVNASLACELPALLQDARQTVLSLSWTANKRYLPLLRPDRVVYEYIDELSIFDGYDETMERDHAALLKRADLTVCTARALYEKARALSPRVLLSPNAGDYPFFSATASAPDAPEAAAASARYRFTLGYYGALASWFDYPLLSAAARARPDWLFLLVGMDYDGTLKKSGLLKSPNVLWIPPQPYSRLPSYLKLFDLALIPFVLNDVTRSTSPVKLFEYMAAQKPILTSDMDECRQYRSVARYHGLSDFLAKAEELLHRRRDPVLLESLHSEAQSNTWDERASQILSALDALPSRSDNTDSGRAVFARSFSA